MDYSIFYKSKPVRKHELKSLGNWDIFISAYTKADRVTLVFSDIQAVDKIWFIHSEYEFLNNDLPNKGIVYNPGRCASESEFVKNFFDQFCSQNNLVRDEIKKKKICIDSTGFIRPHLMYLVLYLYKLGIETFDVLYSEPSNYKDKEKTEFSKGAVQQVRFVDGFASTSNRDVSADLLVVGAGFDHVLVSEVVDDKIHAKKVQVVGFPSLQADMYHQSRIKMNEAEESFPDRKPFFAPANDPFVTASVVSEIIGTIDCEKKITNLYLAPVGTKAQILGFVLYYIGEMEGMRDGGIIFPISESYSQETSEGLSKTWLYRIEFPIV